MRTFTYTIVLASLLVTFSCKKSDSTTYSASMSGSVEYMLPEYTVEKQYVELKASGILAPQDVSWYWYSAKLGISDNDTVYGPDVSFIIPDSLGKYSITAYAKKDGYYTTSSTQYTNVMDPKLVGGESIVGILEGDSTIIDRRDSLEYYCKRYGRLYWMTQNLRYAGAGVSYQHSDSVTTLFGRLYTWNEATLGEVGSGLGKGPRGICPEGWSVPTCEDWCDFANAVKPASVTDSLIFDNGWAGLAPDISAMLYINGVKFWDYCPDNIQTNAHKWNAIPAGRGFNIHSSSDQIESDKKKIKFDQIKYYGFWWVSSLSDDGLRGFFRYLYYDTPDFPVSTADRSSIGMSLRCVRLAE